MDIGLSRGFLVLIHATQTLTVTFHYFAAAILEHWNILFILVP